MTYKDDLLALGSGPDHLIMMDGAIIDEGVGPSAPRTFALSSGMTAGGGPPLCRDVSISLASANNGSRLHMTDSTEMNTSALPQRTMGGWFRVDSIPLDPTCIYKEGGSKTNFAVVLLNGNTLTVQAIVNEQFFLQIYGDRQIIPGRTYHVTFKFDGNAGSNEFSAYLDGEKLLSSNPSPPRPDQANMGHHSGDINWGDSDNSLRVGETVNMAFACPNPCSWNGWASYRDVLDDATEIRDVMFQRGVVGDVVIAADTVANMQAQLDAIANTARPNAPCAIEIEQATDATDFTLSLDSVSFDPLCTVEVLYTGANTLSLENLNGSTSTKNIAPFGGTLNTFTPTSVTLNGMVAGSSVVVVRDDGTVFDYQANVAGTPIVVSLPLTATGMWKAIASLQGYSKPVIEFDAAIDNSINFTQIQEIDSDRSPKYNNASTANLTFVIENGDLIAQQTAQVEARIFYNAAQDFLTTQDGIEWLAANPSSDVDRFTGAAGSQTLVFGPNFHLRNPASGSVLLNAYVITPELLIDKSILGGSVAYNNITLGLKPTVIV